ncbi:MAG: hypothetical protein AAF434_06650 [Pseudomonadota bacterium]
MSEKQIHEDIFHHAQSLVRSNGHTMMGIGALTLFVALNGALIFLQDSTGSALIMVISAAFLPFAYRMWFRNFFQLSRFKIGVARNYQVVEVAIAALEDISKFEPMPRNRVTEPDEPADEEMINEMREMSLAFSELREQIERCEAVSDGLTNYDVANLLLLQEGLRAAKTPGYLKRLTLPETADLASELHEENHRQA